MRLRGVCRQRNLVAPIHSVLFRTSVTLALADAVVGPSNVSCNSDSECASNARCRTPSGGSVAAIDGVQSTGVCLRQCQGSCDILGPGYACLPSEGNIQLCQPESGSCGSLLDCVSDGDCGPTEFCNVRRRCQPGCADDTECPSGTLCQGVRCLPPCDNQSIRVQVCFAKMDVVEETVVPPVRMSDACHLL